MDLSDVLSMNREACSLMFAGKFQVAACCLVTALRQIHCQNEQNALGNPLNEAHDMSIRDIPLEVDNKEKECSTFYLYTCAFLVEGSTFLSTRNGARLCAVLLYNTGLCFQALGFSEATEFRSCRKALKLYDMALSLLRFIDGPDQLLLIALLNNKGFIMNRLYRYDEAQECLGLLQEVLTNSELPKEARRQDILEIFMNVALLYGEHRHAAVA